MKAPRRAAGSRSGWPRRLAWLALVPLLVIGLLLASVALPPVAAPAHELNAPAPGAVRKGPPTRTGLLIAPSLLGLASPPSAAAAATPGQIGAAVAVVNTLLLVPEPAPAASGAAGALALALLAGTRPMRRRHGHDNYWLWRPRGLGGEVMPPPKRPLAEIWPELKHYE